MQDFEYQGIVHLQDELGESGRGSSQEERTRIDTACQASCLFDDHEPGLISSQVSPQHRWRVRWHSTQYPSLEGHNLRSIIPGSPPIRCYSHAVRRSSDGRSRICIDAHRPTPTHAYLYSPARPDAGKAPHARLTKRRAPPRKSISTTPRTVTVSHRRLHVSKRATCLSPASPPRLRPVRTPAGNRQTDRPGSGAARGSDVCPWCRPETCSPGRRGSSMVC